MYILLNNSNIAYFWHNVFNKLNQTLFWRVAVNAFKVLCVYDMTLVLLKWSNAREVILRTVIEISLIYLFMSSLRLQTSATRVSKQNQ